MFGLATSARQTPGAWQQRCDHYAARLQTHSPTAAAAVAVHRLSCGYLRVPPPPTNSPPQLVATVHAVELECMKTTVAKLQYKVLL